MGNKRLWLYCSGGHNLAERSVPHQSHVNDAGPSGLATLDFQRSITAKGDNVPSVRALENVVVTISAPMHVVHIVQDGSFLVEWHRQRNFRCSLLLERPVICFGSTFLIIKTKPLLSPLLLPARLEL